MRDFEEPQEEAESKNVEQKGAAKKAGKKKRRADMDDVDSATMRRSVHEEDEQFNGEFQQKDRDLSVSAEEKVDSEPQAEATTPQQSSKKAQKKKQKAAGGKQQQEEESLLENKENVVVDEHYEKVVSAPVAAAAPTKQKAAKSAPTKPVSGDGKISSFYYIRWAGLARF